MENELDLDGIKYELCQSKDKASGPRERIATAILAALVQHKGQCLEADVDHAVDFTDQLMAKLNF